MKKHLGNSLEQIAESIRLSVNLLEKELGQVSEIETLNKPQPSLLQQCDQLIEADQNKKETIRTIHHFACTGGTLFTKCLASMPNTLILSEVEPQSTIPPKSLFTPTDLIQLLRKSTRHPSKALISNVFLSGLGVIQDSCKRRGLHLILRDHSHSKYCYGDIDQKAPTLLKTVAAQHRTLSVITVRHPLDSYLSLATKNWLHFHPVTVEEYAKRYLKFLNDNKGIKVFKYEDLIENSGDTIRGICDELKLPYFSGFEDVFGVHIVSGDSGRTSNLIGKRERREIPEKVKSEFATGPLPTFHELCRILGYRDVLWLD
ncbi:MAG: hypothetical protein V7720_11505 [Halioglobus sp.]